MIPSFHQPGLEPPIHIPIAHGPVKPVKVKEVTDKQSEENDEEEVEKMCTLCHEAVEKNDLMR